MARARSRLSLSATQRPAVGGQQRIGLDVEGHVEGFRVERELADQARGDPQQRGADARHIAVYARAALKAAPGVAVRHMPDNAAQAAQALFATLRELDATGVKLIWVETPPDSLEWAGVRDRLQRAAA